MGDSRAEPPDISAGQAARGRLRMYEALHLIHDNRCLEPGRNYYVTAQLLGFESKVSTCTQQISSNFRVWRRSACEGFEVCKAGFIRLLSAVLLDRVLLTWECFIVCSFTM